MFKNAGIKPPEKNIVNMTINMICFLNIIFFDASTYAQHIVSTKFIGRDAAKIMSVFLYPEATNGYRNVSLYAPLVNPAGNHKNPELLKSLEFSEKDAQIM